MKRTFALSALAASLLTIADLHFVTAEEPKPTGTVDIASAVPDAEKLQAFSGTGVILTQKDWEQLAADWGIKIVPKVDFSKELLLVGTWRGTKFKFLGDVKNGDLTVELVGDKDIQPGFRYKILSLDRTGITKFQGKDLPAVASEMQPIKEKPSVDLSGEISTTSLQSSAPPNLVITSQKEWDTLVKGWNIKDAPKVDFNKEFLIVGTSPSASFDLSSTVKNGDLIITTKGTKELAPGFRWRLRSIPREGIKTIQGKEVPKTVPVPKPPATNPPTTNPPVTKPPATNPPVTRPPATNPLGKNVRLSNYPVTNVPVVSVPAFNWPVTSTPVTSTPVTSVPAFNWPVTSVPATNVPVVSVPAFNWPVTSRPVTSVPVTSRPAFNWPVTSVPAFNWPVTSRPAGP
jgi:hypothetical protein